MEALNVIVKPSAGEVRHAAKQIRAKFVISPQEAQRLLASKAVRRNAKRKAVSSFEETTYYDTPYFLLKKHSITLRIRQTGRRIVQTLKAGNDFTDGALTRWEVHKTLEKTTPDLEMVRQVLARDLISAGALKRLVPIFATKVHRTKLGLQTANAHLELVYDQGEIFNVKSGEVVETISEIQVKLKSGSRRAMFALLCDLNEKCVWQQITISKAQRGYAAIRRSQALRPRKHKGFANSNDSDGFSAMRNAMSSALSHFFANNPNMLTDKPEAIHQTRVAIRRMRAILHAFKSIVSYMDRKALNGELRWLQTKLGESRDWHVLRHDTLPKMKGLTSEQKDEIGRLAQKNHAKLLPKALDFYNSRRAQRLILHIQHWLADSPAEGGPNVAEIGRSATQSNIRRLRRLGRLTIHKPIYEIHAIRIKAKKLRYTLEILPTQDEAGDAKALKSLASLQQKLGDLNDTAKCLELTAASRASELSPETREQVRVWAEKQINKCITPARVHYNAVLRWEGQA